MRTKFDLNSSAKGYLRPRIRGVTRRCIAIQLFVTASATFAVACSSASPPAAGNAANPAVAAPGQLSTQSVTSPASSSAAVARATDAEKQDYLTNFVRPETILHSFHAAEGMWVDCVDVNRQPSMLNPQLAGKPIDQPPPLASIPTGPPPGTQFAHMDTEDHANEVDEDGNVRHCDPGTVPIRRITAVNLSAYATLQDFFAKGPNRALQGASLDPNYQKPKPPSVAGYEYARETQTVTNWGFQSFISVFDPYVEVAPEHSINQIWVMTLAGANTQSAETGWNVDSSLYNDTKPHLFIYWTNDNYQSTGCYNLNCTGFVQTNNSVTLGGVLSPVSSIGGSQYLVELSWEKSSSTANWWLLWQGTTWLGYYPASLYTNGMQTQATFDAFGGEVYNSEPNGGHTGTWMGSGRFAADGWTNAAYQRHLQYINTNYNTIDVTPISDVTNANCYSMTNGYDGSGDGWGAYEFLGGPGSFFNVTNCP